MTHDRYTPTYRASEVSQVMRWIKAGQSGCIIGLRGAGKSNFLRFLLQENVQKHYLEQDDTHYVFSLINLLALSEVTERAVYRLLLASLSEQLREVGSEEDLEKVNSLQSKVKDSRDDDDLQRAIEQCFTLLCHEPNQRIVLLFDEFDDVFRNCDPSLFRFLRTVRDAHKEQISYIVIVTHDLAHLRNEVTEVDHFFRLVARYVCGLGPYSQDDARQMLRYLATQRKIEFDENDTAYLIEQSGGHAGLLKSILSQIWDILKDSNLRKIVPTLQNEPVVQAECRKVWNNLPESEQIALHSLIAGHDVNSQMLQRLERKGLTREVKGKSLPFSPVFANFIGQQTPPPMKVTIISRSPRQVQLEGRLINDLTELEFEALLYLYKGQGRVRTKDDLIENVYRHQYINQEGGLIDARLHQLIARLRRKIEPDRNNPRYVVTVHGEGYKFIEPGEL